MADSLKAQNSAITKIAVIDEINLITMLRTSKMCGAVLRYIVLQASVADICRRVERDGANVK